jgi:coenzyme F420-reducing hydrogenase alpha subunit
VNEKSDLIIEFITRVEGLHKIYLYLNDELVDEKPFYINVQTNDFEILSQPN